VDATEGGFLSSCSDWANAANLELLAEASVIPNSYPLEEIPVEETLTVSVNGEEVSSSDWSYDEGSNSVIFDMNPPVEGDEISISYATFGECD